tara:strand:- start:2 stop:271 length:270 start_codon:yes stop_codon:yes gene_type:complete
MSRAYIKTVEKAVNKIGILAGEKDFDKLTEIDWIKVQNSILEIESHIHDLIHIYDLLDMRKKSNYFIADMDQMITIRERELDHKESDNE